MVVKVAINGYGTIGKRVADAVDAQNDMEIVGVTKTRPAFGCDLAVKKGYPIYCTYDDEAKISAFAEAGYECHGGLSDLLAEVCPLPDDSNKSNHVSCFILLS